MDSVLSNDSLSKLHLYSPLSYSLLIFAQFCVALALNLVTLVKLSQVFVLIKRRTRRPISPFLISLIVNWFLLCVHYLPYLVYNVVAWSPSGNARNEYLIFWLGFTPSTHLSALPITVFFLSVDRILSMKYPMNYLPDFRKYLLRFSLISLTVIALVNFCVNFLNSRPKKGCLLYGCTKDYFAAQFYQWWRIVVSILNVNGGILFLYLLWQFNERVKSDVKLANAQFRQKASNKMALITIYVEFCFNFVPFFVPNVTALFIEKQNYPNWGPYSLVLGFIETTIFSIQYRRILAPRKSASESYGDVRLRIQSISTTYIPQKYVKK